MLNSLINKNLSLSMRLSKILSGTAMALTLAFAASGLQSCKAPKDVTYFQDVTAGTMIETSAPADMKVLPDDRLSILVASKDPALASLFNLRAPSNSHLPGEIATNYNQGSGSDRNVSYVVDSYGDIQFPILGTLHVAGMKRSEVSEYIQNELIKRNLVKDPIVLVDFLNHSVTVLGDVNKPGRVIFDKDRYTILDAIADAGDLNIQGKRNDVKVMRNENGRQTTYTVDLTNAAQTMQSPAYYLQQNDVIYVSPTDTKKRTTTANGNAPLTPSFWISIASLATTIAVLVIK